MKLTAEDLLIENDGAVLTPGIDYYTAHGATRAVCALPKARISMPGFGTLRDLLFEGFFSQDDEIRIEDHT
jgi:hypothetical protein